MKLKKNIINSENCMIILSIRVKHFENSVKDIKSYSELTKEEREFISEDIFNQLFE